LPQSATVCECFARDGLQREAFVPTEKKVEIINRLMRAGVKRIEATSFAHPKYLPQFADSEEVLTRIERVAGARVLALIPNTRGFDRMLSMCEKGKGPDGITVVVTASESYNKRNVGKSIGGSMEEIAGIVPRAKAAGLSVIGCVGTAFGCPIEGEVRPEAVLELARRYRDMGADEIMVGDTTGMSNPLKTHRLLGLLTEKTSADLIAHFHDTRGMGIANALAALQCGITLFDSCLGGAGGGMVKETEDAHSGNVATEDLLCMFEEMGIATGIDWDAVVDCLPAAREILGRDLYGKAARTGRVRH